MNHLDEVETIEQIGKRQVIGCLASLLFLPEIAVGAVIAECYEACRNAINNLYTKKQKSDLSEEQIRIN